MKTDVDNKGFEHISKKKHHYKQLAQFYIDQDVATSILNWLKK